MKRKRRIGDFFGSAYGSGPAPDGAGGLPPGTPSNRTASGSSFVECPCCGASFPLYQLDGHLDRCLAGVNSAGDTATAGAAAAVPVAAVSAAAVLPPPPPHALLPPPLEPAAASTCSGRSTARPLNAFAQLRQAPGKGARLIGGGNLSAAELADACPVLELVKDALPAGLAESLLTEMLAAASGWPQSTWLINGVQHLAARRTLIYALGEGPDALADSKAPPDEQPEYNQQLRRPTPSMQEAAEAVERVRHPAIRLLAAWHLKTMMA